MPFSMVLSTMPDGGAMPQIPPCLVRARRRQAGDVGLDQRLEGLRREAADEDEGEVAGVREARLVEGECSREIPLVHGRDGFGLPPRAVLADRRFDRLVEDGIRARQAVGQQRLGSRRHRREHRRIGARLREAQVEELEHGFEILRRAAARHAFADFVDERRHRNGLAGEDLVERHAAEAADTPRRDHVVRDASGDEIGVARQRRPARR